MTIIYSYRDNIQNIEINDQTFEFILLVLREEKVIQLYVQKCYLPFLLFLSV